MPYLLSLLFLLLLCACGPAPDATNEMNDRNEAPDRPKIVFVTGDEEYRSEESMPMLAKMLERNLGAETVVGYSLDSTGTIDPNNVYHISRLDELADADLMVVFARYRQLPADQAQLITDYAESGRPIVGFRTATHTFKYVEPRDSALMPLNDAWPAKVFGQQWITHHGHFDDGSGKLTSVNLAEGQTDHPILRGVEPFEAYSWLYHVDGGDWKLSGDSAPLLVGHSLRSNHEEKGQLDKFPLDNPVAWTKTYTGSSGKTARVFFTTLGHPFDFREESMRKLALNGIYWALGREGEIPEGGAEADFVDEYAPNNSGFGEKFKKGVRPDGR
ncbi:type 1 glutamine amidotransferase [Lewinella aquimaris]|uniref:Type 1 glutamine amidotransferase n=1 Tax=Neolewinella aquimaris TaxID=1835722 RepID=A0A840E9P7_9BACT|nr:ThuA domain-containing protein [Neolewinella aquimaris]MBB4080275.1 type 1 glutamine amidotransferase [Neolewinella aquimaris]